MTKLLAAIILFGFSGCLIPAAQACSPQNAVAAFIMINDHNNDGALDLNEWMHATQQENQIISFKLHDPAEFAAHDLNHDGKVEARELGFSSIRYRHDPCERYTRLRLNGGHDKDIFAWH